MNRGFTLVELSIVLIIVGLLVGGILVGSSLIEAAKINSSISQMRQFDAAVSTFRSKYKGLPGDSQYFSGNGDGMIGRAPSSQPTRTDVNAYGNEMINVWNNLFPEKFAAASMTAGVTDSPVAGVNAFDAKIGNSKTTIIISAMSAGSFDADTANKRNYYVILSPANMTAPTGSHLFTRGANGSRALKPAQLLSIDQKIDDANGVTGNVLAGAIPVTGAGIYTVENASCSTSGTYVVANDSFECTPLVRVGTQTGQLY